MGTFLICFVVVNLLLLSANGQVYPDDVISTIMARLDEQQRQIDTQRSKIEAQQRQIDAQQKLTYKQQNDISALQSKVDEQKRQIESQEKRIVAQQSKLDAQQQHTSKQQHHMDTQLQKIVILQEMVNNEQKEIQRLAKSQKDVNSLLKSKPHEVVQFPPEMNGQGKRQLPIQGTIAFTAVLTHPLNNLGVNQNIVFDLVYTNVGDGYNKHHGVFTAPVSGVYVFYMTIYTHQHNLAFCGIVVNGAFKTDVYVQGGSVSNAGSQMLVVQLNKGDDVSVQNKHQADYIHSDGNIYTTFSGFLLQDLSDFSGGIVG